MTRYGLEKRLFAVDIFFKAEQVDLEIHSLFQCYFSLWGEMSSINSLANMVALLLSHTFLYILTCYSLQVHEWVLAVRQNFKQCGTLLYYRLVLVEQRYVTFFFSFFFKLRAIVDLLFSSLCHALSLKHIVRLRVREEKERVHVFNEGLLV